MSARTAKVRFLVSGKGWRKTVTVETTPAAARRILRGARRMKSRSPRG